MKTEARLEKFDDAHRRAVAAIESLLADSDDDVRMLVRWLMETDANPYSYLPEEWARCMSDAPSFARLCGHVRHALVDDGEISFVAVNGQPRISFHPRWEKGYEDRVLTAQERDLRDNGLLGRPARYEFTQIDGVAAFIAARDLYEVEDLKRCFLWDARRDLGHAVRHYGANPLFRQEWLDEAKAASRRTRP